MALLNKLFFPTSTKSAATSSSWTSTSKLQNINQSVNSENYLNHFPFDGKQVRVLLFRECDNRGRRLLFDSNALQKVLLKERNEQENLKKFSKSKRDEQSLPKTCKDEKNGLATNSFIEVCEEYGFKHNRPNSEDITNIGEMVFGALAMSFQGTSLKVHWLQSPLRILCSQVFLTPVRSSQNQPSPYSTISFNSLSTPRTSISSEQSSIDGVSISSFSIPFSMRCGSSGTASEQNSEQILNTGVVGSGVGILDQQTLYANPDIRPRYSSTFSTTTDSGCSGMSSRGRQSSDQWSSSYQYSTRSSLGSVLSEPFDNLRRKSSIDSSNFPSITFDGGEVASDGCLQKRIFRNLCTSFENENSVTDFIGFTSDNYNDGSTKHCGGSEGGFIEVPQYRRASCSAQETHSNPEMNKRRDFLTASATKSFGRRPKLGLAVCITMSESFEDEMELFCSEHIALLESMLSRLRAFTERAYLHHKEFLQIMYQALQETKQWLNDLFTAPRLKSPVWLNITTSGNKYSKNVAERFLKELCWLLSFADTKDTNFFISTMLTAILTHHLGWVSTVSAFHSKTSLSERAAVAIEQRAKLLQVSQKHPYNALWAQMGDLYGANGTIPKVARTVIYGTEKLSLERLLNILSYFIRCGEVRRTTKHEDFNETVTNSIINQNNIEFSKESSTITNFKAKSLIELKKSLPRTQTFKQNINMISDFGNEELNEINLLNTLKKNEIPNVLAFRDSRFVQQELRIGNYLMDTGIEKNSLRQKSKNDSFSDNHIQLLVTTPENIQMNVDEENLINSNNNNNNNNNNAPVDTNVDAVDSAVEAIELSDAADVDFLKDEQKLSVHKSKRDSFWNIIPKALKDGFHFNDLKEKQQQPQPQTQQTKENVVKNNKQMLCTIADNSSTTKQNHNKDKKNLLVAPQNNNLSLSDLITQNSIGKSDRMTWGIEPIKENVSLEEQMHFDNCQKLFDREHSAICTKTNDDMKNKITQQQQQQQHQQEKKSNNDSGIGVVFVLGDNEPLVNLKKSTEDLTMTEESFDTTDDAAADKKKNVTHQNLCSIHQQQSKQTSTYLKKHSGVKFNFEQFPQIATNYMRSKNLLMSNYELLMSSKSIKSNLDINTSCADKNISDIPPQISQETSLQCAMCNSITSYYQTPSNATELELETDDDMQNYQNKILLQNSNVGSTLNPNNSSASVDTLTTTGSIKLESENKQNVESSTANISTKVPLQNTKNIITNKKYCGTKRTADITIKNCMGNEALRLLKLPVPRTKENIQEDELPKEMKLRAGFIPSLFLNVYDHYVSDMVLQGTYASPNIWEMNLREDLVLSAQSASLISQPAENIAIIADMEKWNVRILSSRTHCFPFAVQGQGHPVGMSQLISSMLETVQAMNCTGISAYECLSYLESKLQEIYLQSETLAAFLLETDFCPLSTVTSALNLSENDVPLLLSVATMHTPQISKKCGISFR